MQLLKKLSFSNIAVFCIEQAEVFFLFFRKKKQVQAGPFVGFLP